MTCREFRNISDGLTLWELTRGEKPDLLSHAGRCANCGAWLQQQRALAANVQALQTRTADVGASPRVEQALLQALRERTPEPARLKTWDRFTPLAWRLSRFFEMGAYAAAAAAIVVLLFLGARLLRDRQVAAGRQSASVNNVSAAPTRGRAGQNSPSKVSAPVLGQGTLASASNRGHRLHAAPLPADDGASRLSAEEPQSNSEADYVPLMFCDPLSCSTDTQVVRMELPPPAGQDSQPQVADMVVGYDGVVRAVRIVN
jgi:hypothetical protein